jgi:hypothetical protein
MTTRLLLIVLGTRICGLASEASAQMIQLYAVDSGLSSPSANYRWLDVADQEYSAVFRTNYRYTQATVVVNLIASPQPVHGTLVATHLKPNFAYQLKFVGNTGTANERIGLAGRYWQEEWIGAGWTNGQNLNNKGNGYFPTPNDDTYFSRRDLADTNSPTGLHYQYTCYLVADYFITDSNGNATVPSFELDSSYHVLWKPSQRTRVTNDGPLKSVSFQASSAQPAYDTNYPERTVSVFGEWERLPTGGIQLRPGEYPCEVVLTEESFHGSGGQYAGSWAAAMSGNIHFRVAPRLTGPVLDPGDFSFDIADCYPGTTNDVQRCFDLGSTNGWQTVFSFVSTTPTTNWSDRLPSLAADAYYRITTRTAP